MRYDNIDEQIFKGKTGAGAPLIYLSAADGKTLLKLFVWGIGTWDSSGKQADVYWQA
ncbi:hypothetical protein ACFLWE_01200 [Chloroflexota bacterium]